jgi:hypothetical protein
MVALTRWIGKMSDLSLDSHRAIANICSTYSGAVRAQALQECPNMSESDLWEAETRDSAADNDIELALCAVLNALCGGENVRSQHDLKLASNMSS